MLYGLPGNSNPLESKKGNQPMPEWPFDIVELCVAPDGNAAWSGRLREVNTEETHGPLATQACGIRRIAG